MFIDKNGVVRMPKAYLAGTEIFYPNTLETQEKYHKLCEKYGQIRLHGTNLKTMWQKTILPTKRNFNFLYTMQITFAEAI